MKRMKVFYILLILLLFSSSSFSENLQQEIGTIIQAYGNATVSISFYGQILDQDSLPIEGAQVTVKVIYYDLSQEFFENQKTLNLLTDSDGKFQLSDQGSLIFIEIEKSGYEFNRSENPSMSYNYDPSMGTHQPDINAPVVFQLNKKSCPAYLTGSGPLLEHTMRVIFDRSEAFQGEFYIMQGFYDSYGRPGLMPDGKPLKLDSFRSGNRDIQITGSISGSDYELVFTPLLANSGLILSDDLRNEAPESGFSSSVVVTVPEDQRVEKYIYAKISDGAFYSRMKIYASEHRGEVLLKVEVWTNPAGSRNLKYDEEYQDDEKTWRRKLANLRYAATLSPELRNDYLKEYDLGSILGILPDGSFDEDLFIQETDVLNQQRKLDNPKWWHVLE